MDHPIEIEGLKKIFYVESSGERGILQRAAEYLTMKKEKVVVFDSLNLKIKKGEIYGLLGTNGAGKTTLIRILSTTILPDGGKALVNGLDVTDPKNKDRISGTIGVMLGDRSRSFYWRLTAKQNMDFVAALYNIDKNEKKERIDYLLDFVGLEDRRDDYIYNFSTGMLNRLAIARAFIHSPQVLLLDEFMGNLDPMASFEISAIIKKLAKIEGKTVLFTTHNSYEAEHLSDRIGVLHNGRIVAEGHPRELKRKFGSEEARVNVILEKMPKSARRMLGDLKKLKGAKAVDMEENQVTLSMHRPGKDLESIIEIIKKNDARIYDLDIHPPSLQNAFINIIKGEKND